MWTALSVVNSLASLLGLGWAQEVLSQCAEGHTHPHPERNSLLAPRAVFSIPTALGARSKPKLRQPWHREVAWGEEHGLGNKAPLWSRYLAQGEVHLQCSWDSSPQRRAQLLDPSQP